MRYSALAASIISLVLGAIVLLFVREGVILVVLFLSTTLSAGLAVVLGARAWNNKETQGLIAVILGNVGLWEMALSLFWIIPYYSRYG